jgi:3alpha(or 20beta)-hydroxysteroid dehydrogenase
MEPTVGKLDAKVAIVTGAARGQGEASARLFAAEGAFVVIGDVLDDLSETVATDIGDRAVASHLDVTDPASWQATTELAASRFGSIDILVNNAGILRLGTIEEMTFEEYLSVINVNQHGCWLGIKHVAPIMRSAGRGSIVNVSSQAGLVPGARTSAYAASKFAIRGITRVAAAELGHDGIRVNAILPGAVDTDMLVSRTMTPEERNAFYARQPIPRIGTTDEIAKLVLFLASDDSTYCTGADFSIDGGAVAVLPIPPEQGP